MSDDREQLLEQVVMGDLSRDDARVRALAVADPAFARELDETLELQSSLDEVGDAVQSGAHDEADAPGLSTARELLQGLASEPNGAGRSRRRILWIAGLGAAAAIVLILARPFGGGTWLDGLPDAVLGVNVENMSPAGTSDVIEQFTWTFAEPGTFDVEARDPKTNALIDFANGLGETMWTPRDARPGAWPEGWPDEVQWQVTARGTSGQVRDSQTATVQKKRSPR
ncbi:MAG: hypothetical protein GY711_28920 [bacterium]|nr:hypothetical protein [bacterium]